MEEFENVILRTEPNGTSVKLKDVARVELGLQNYGFDVRLDDQPVSGFGVLLLPGANALQIADAVKARMQELSRGFPPGVEWFVAFDATTFITHAIHEVVFTLCAAVVLVFIVMLVFLQSFRATLIPTLVVPVALMGAFIGMEIFGFSINQLTLFGMVLAIGIVVDDAIVVIESVERLMREEHLSPRDATRKAMDQITSPIIAISLVLAAVFIPAAMQSGSVGVIYRQFAMTIAISMLFSAFLALSLTPALCATLLRPEHLKENRFFRLFNRSYDYAQSHYLRGVRFSLRHKTWWLAGFAVLVLGGVYLLVFKVPGSFVPDEDQGYTLGIVQLPPGSTMHRTREVMRRVGAKIRQSEAVDSVFEVAGFSFSGGNDESVGIFFIRMKEIEKRKETAEQFIGWAFGNISGGERDAQVFFANLPVINGLSNFSGFDLWLEDQGGKGNDALVQAQNMLLAKTSQNRSVQGVRPNGLPPSPRLELTLDRAQAQSMGLAVGDVYNAIQLMLAPVYVNDFYYQGRVLRVQMQADASFRMNEDSLQRFYLPTNAATSNAFVQSGETNSDGMVPLASVVRSKWVVAPPTLQRYNGYARGQYRRFQCAGTQLRRSHEGNGEHHHAGSAAGLWPRLGGPVVAGDHGRCRGALAVQPFNLRGIPVSGCALRKLGDPHRGSAVGSGGHHRRHHCGLGHEPVRRRVLQDRPHHHHRLVCQERHPDRGVRAARAAARSFALRSRHGGCSPAAAPHPDDFIRFHPGCVAAGVLQWRGCQCASRHRHRCGRRHVVGRGVRRAPGAGVLCGDPAPGGRQVRGRGRKLNRG